MKTAVRRGLWIGVPTGLLAAGLCANQLIGPAPSDEGGQPEGVPSATAGTNAEVKGSASPTPSAAAGLVCSRIVAVGLPTEEGGEGYFTIRLTPNLQPKPNKGPVGLDVTYTQVDSQGNIAGVPEEYKGQDQVDVTFASQAGRLTMGVTVGNQRVECPAAFAEVGPPEDGDTPIVTIGPFNPSGPQSMHPFEPSPASS